MANVILFWFVSLPRIKSSSYKAFLNNASKDYGKFFYDNYNLLL